VQSIQLQNLKWQLHRTERDTAAETDARPTIKHSQSSAAVLDRLLIDVCRISDNVQRLSLSTTCKHSLTIC